MTELSSTGEAAESYRRSATPAPPRPPGVATDPGPSTAAMPPVSAGPDAADRSYSYVAPPLAQEPLTGIGHLPPTGVAAPPAPPTTSRFRPGAAKVAVRGPRRAKLVVRRVDPWTVLKFSFLFSICLLIVWVVAVSSLFSLLRTEHVFDNINQVLQSATADPTTKGIHIDPTSDQVTLWAAILGAVNALLFTALATLGAFLYNLIAMLVGGVEVSLSERD